MRLTSGAEAAVMRGAIESVRGLLHDARKALSVEPPDWRTATERIRSAGRVVRHVRAVTAKRARGRA